MRWVVVGLVLMFTVAVAASPAFEEVRTASACSCADCDFFRDANLVVRGTVSGWTYRTDAAGEPLEVARVNPAYSRPEDSLRERPVELRVQVSEVYKGSAAESILVVTGQYNRYLRAEASPLFGYWAWPEEAGVCFGLASDPTGQDLLMQLRPSLEFPGRYELVVGPAPYASANDRTFAGRFPGLDPRPPAAGDSPPAAETSDDWMFVSAIGAGCLLLTLLLVLVGPRRDKRR